MPHSLARRASLAAIGLAALGAAVKIQAQEPQIPKDLGGPERATTHLATDKPLYRPGEVVYARAAVLDAFTRAPAAHATWVAFEVRSPRGDIVATIPSQVQGGIAPFAWILPAELAGGEYKMIVRSGDGFAPSETTFDVRSYRVPRLKTELELAKKAYGPGETVLATLQAVRAEGGIPKGATATAVATVDGVEIHRSEVALDDTGACSVRFTLPVKIAEGEGTLALVIRDGGVQETAAKTIPIVLNKIKIEVFPEGGDLVTGLETRLYVEARTLKGKPADVAGRILDSRGQTVAGFRTEHEGRARVTFTPSRPGRSHILILDEPAGAGEIYTLPEVQEEGFALAALDDGMTADDATRFRVAATAAGKVRLALFQREREVASRSLELAAGTPQTIVLTPPEAADGVLRATLFDEAGLPRAERLVFRKPVREVKVSLEATPGRGALRDHVTVTIKTSDRTGKPVSALVGLAAVDDAVLETIEKRERAPRLPVQALLAADVRELRDAHVYLEAGPESGRRTDLLLGTQGWRRFAFIDATKFVAAQGDAAERALALRRAAEGLALLGGGEDEFLVDRDKAMDMPRKGGRGLALAPADPAPAGRPVNVLARLEPRAKKAPGPMGPVAAPPPAEKPMGEFKKKEWDGRARRAADAKAAWARSVPVAVREFAHHALPATGERTDFTETLYWNAGLQTSEQGTAQVTFDLADSITTIRIKADALGRDGALGAADTTVEARRAFYVEPKLPLEVTAGDTIGVPIAFVNGTHGTLSPELTATLTGPLTLGDAPRIAALAADARSRVLLPIKVGMGRGSFDVRLLARAGVESDDVMRTIAVVPAGFPIAMDMGGQLDGATKHVIRIPDKIEPGSLTTECIVYPSPLASLAQAVEALLREPGGCFEQTSSTNYPNVMVLQYLSSHQGVDPAIMKRASELLDRGYKKLTGFECRQKGYEWFGGDPGHEALSAYGLLEFTDMSSVHPVDQEMLARTRAWLLARRDGKGGFQRNERALDTFGRAPAEVTDAYITWALLSAHVPGLEKEVALVRSRAATSEDPYLLALSANVLLEARDDAAFSILDRLAKKQAEGGSVPGARTSITSSGGEALEIETTALAVLAWLRSPAHTARTESAMRWLLERAKGGRFGSTQSTILALKAIVAYDAAHASPRKSGSVLLVVDGSIYDEKMFKADTQGAIVMPSFAEALSPGEHTVELKLVGGAPMPYSLQVRYHARTPASSPACKVTLATSLSRSEVNEGEPVDVRVELANTTAEGLPMTMAIVGLPGGVEARADQLKELVKEGKIDFFETRGRDVILYARSMAPKEKRSIVLSCIAAIPGRYTGAASRGYLYYTDEDKTWIEPLTISIKGT